MAQQSSNKGNPAMKRMQNKNLEAKRIRCWRNGQEKKAANKLKNLEREVGNNAKREVGILTKWETAKAVRLAKRHP